MNSALPPTDTEFCASLIRELALADNLPQATANEIGKLATDFIRGMVQKGLSQRTIKGHRQNCKTLMSVVVKKASYLGHELTDLPPVALLQDVIRDEGTCPLHGLSEFEQSELDRTSRCLKRWLKLGDRG